MPWCRNPLALTALGAVAITSSATAARPSKPATAVPHVQAAGVPGPAPHLGPSSPNDALRRAVGHADPAAAALTLAALRRFANAAADPTAFDRALAKRMARVRNAKVIAKRIIARIDALPSARRTAAFGNGSAQRVPDVAAFREVAARFVPVFGGVGTTSTTDLPADVTPPKSFRLRASGLVAVETTEADGDEVAAMLTMVRCGDGEATYEIDTVSVPTVEGALGGVAMPLDAKVYDGMPNNGSRSMLVSAVFESDGDDATAREEYQAMIVYAQGLAEQLAQPDDSVDKSLARFVFALDQTAWLLSVSAPQRWPIGAVQKTVLTANASVASLAATPASMDGAIPFKLIHDHDLPVGRYKLYIDAPTPAGPATTNLQVTVKNLQSLDPEAGGDDLSATVDIGGASLVHEFAKNDDAHPQAWSVRRKLAANQVIVSIQIADFDAGPAWMPADDDHWFPCGTSPEGVFYGVCPDTWSEIDFSPRAYTQTSYHQDFGRSIALIVDLTTGKITGDVTGKLGDTLQLAGSDAPRGKLQLVLSKVAN